MVIPRAVTKITVININCIQPFNDDFTLKNVISTAQTLEMIYDTGICNVNAFNYNIYNFPYFLYYVHGLQNFASNYPCTSL
jgi:hypothetical protein